MTKEKESGKFMNALTKVHEATKQTISKPIEMTQQASQAIQIMGLMQRQAGEFCYIMDGILDPMDLNESLVKVEMGIAYLKRSDAEDRVELIDDIIRELKNCRSIAKRMDTRDKYEEEKEKLNANYK